MFTSTSVTSVVSQCFSCYPVYFCSLIYPYLIFPTCLVRNIKEHSSLHQECYRYIWAEPDPHHVDRDITVEDLGNRPIPPSLYRPIIEPRLMLSLNDRGMCAIKLASCEMSHEQSSSPYTFIEMLYPGDTTQYAIRDWACENRACGHKLHSIA